MVHVIAEVEKPYDAATPLVSGMFVQAEIAGRELKDVVVLPRSALHDGDHVHVVELGDVLRMRPVDVLRRERERVVLRAGVAAGERVCTTSLEAPTDGMRVRVEQQQQPASGR
jgi:multidrug efflux pump subunit AcrA (membrane-fusion protein)